MPQFKLSDDDRKALVIFLKSRRGNQPAESPVEAFTQNAAKVTSAVPESVTSSETMGVAAQTSAARGEQLIQEYACLSCHKLGNKDGGISPDLSYEGLMRDQPVADGSLPHAALARARLQHARFGLPDDDYKAMAAYPYARTAQPPAMTPAETYKALCSRCHGEKGDGHGINSIYLDPAPRDLTNAEFMASKPEARFLASITLGVPGTSMPAWGKSLTDDQIKSTLDYVFETYVHEPTRQLKPRKVPEQNPVTMAPASRHAAKPSSCSAAPAATDARPMAEDRIPSTSRRGRAILQQRSIREQHSRPAPLSNRSCTASRARRCPPGWTTASQNEVGDIVNYIRSLNEPAK
jgi:mono/diheme cytochrome c family protein